MASSWPATAYMLQRKDSPALLRAPLVHDIARKLGKKPSQVLLNSAVAHGTTVSPKAGSFEHVQVGVPAASSMTGQSDTTCWRSSALLAPPPSMSLWPAPWIPLHASLVQRSMLAELTGADNAL